MDLLYSYPARRFAVISQRGMVTTSQPLATAAGADVLAAGGNAIDAAVATTAALNVVQPSATGIGGDLFAQVYIKQSGELMALNGSGRAPYAASPDAYRDLGYREMPARGIHAVTVPGAVDGWCVLLQKYGTLSLERVLAPAIRLAETGFPVTTVAQRFWQTSAEELRTD